MDPSTVDPGIELRWRQLLTGTDPDLPAFRRRMRLLPSEPRCKTCNMPFGGIGGFLMRHLGGGPWPKNPRYCRRCEGGWQRLGVGGAEVEATFLFADVRGSTGLAERLPPTAFRGVMDRFYRMAAEVLIQHEAVVDNYVGDEVVALFVPSMAGTDHARLAVSAARALVDRVHREPAGGGDDASDQLPIGVGVHTGVAFIGLVGDPGGHYEFTALGDSVNAAARLASAAGPGEILVSMATAAAAGLDPGGLPRREVEIRGRSAPLEVVVLGDPATAAVA